MRRIDVITLFPDWVDSVSAYGVIGRALHQGLVDLECYNPREYTHDRHGAVDARPYGGGPGMVMCYQPLYAAIEVAKQRSQEARVVHLSPQGCLLNQREIERLYAHQNLIVVCGRYEGIDERLLEAVVDEDVSIGDFVVSGGELPAMLLIDALVRLIPGALGHPDSTAEDSFQQTWFDHPHYTRPQNIEGHRVPEVLLSGNHEAIRRWRMEQALRRTQSRRPDLIRNARLNQEELELLERAWADWAAPADDNEPPRGDFSESEYQQDK